MTPEQIQALFGRLEELLDRVTRLETRMVRLMLHLRCDPHTGKPIPVEIPRG